VLPPGLPANLHAGTRSPIRYPNHAEKDNGHAQPERCLGARIAAILLVYNDWPREELCPRRCEEAVFSSSEDRIRASQATTAVAGYSIVSARGCSRAPYALIRRAAESLFSVLFPSNCRICGLPLLNVSRLPVCTECLAGIHAIRGKVCSICGERVLSSYAQEDSDGVLRCPVCRRVERPFLRAVAFGSYDGELRELIHLLKYNGVRPAANVLGRTLAQALAQLRCEFGAAEVLVIPVPLYRGKRRQRGFNQAELITRSALKALGDQRLVLAADALVRTRETQSQIGLTSHQRGENMRGAFAVANAGAVEGREIILVDDVYTTGTTATECAKVLRRAGAVKVWVATAARTLKLASKYEGPETADGQSFNVSKLQRFKDDNEIADQSEEHVETLKP
jgi:ComF family protein